MHIDAFTVMRMLQALQERRQFMLIQVSLTARTNGYAITIPSQTFMATTPAGRKQFERDANGWRWAAGGGLIVLCCLDGMYGLVRYRDKGAPSYGNHWTLGSGLASAANELIHPEIIAVREAFEEFVIACPHGIIVPRFGDTDLDIAAFGAVGSSYHLRQKTAVGGMFSTKSYFGVEARFKRVSDERNLYIALEGLEAETKHKGIVVVDTHTRGIDLLKVIEVQIPFRFDQIAVFDGEEDKEGNPLNATVGCLDLRARAGVANQCVAVFQDGKRTTESPFRLEHMTPNLWAVVTSM